MAGRYKPDAQHLVVTDQHVTVGTVRALTHSTITADVRLTITCANGRTYSLYRRLRLPREKGPNE